MRGSGTVGASRNIASANMMLDGEAPDLLTSVSGEAERAGTVPNVGSPGNLQRFIPQATGDNARFYDSEFKLFNYMANKLGPSSDAVSGAIQLHSELPLCVSCNSVLNQFMNAYPNIDIIISTGR